jgi:hypothetical protein
MSTRNEVTHLGLSELALSLSKGQFEQATNRKPQVGGMTQEAKALSNVRDTLTWVRQMGR